MGDSHMQPISENDVRRRLQRDNPWWNDKSHSIPEEKYPRRVYFKPFAKLALDRSIQRAAVLLGPRRVGKTVMIKQLVSEAVTQGLNPENILYASIDTPIYAGFLLEKYLSFFTKFVDNENYLVIFDEIQYLKDWEVHLKDLVDSYKNIKFVATGSAAAALRLKSRESGAGRFSEFMLPPLTFYEFLMFQNLHDELVEEADERVFLARDIERLNVEFINYLNYGGYPEAVLNAQIRENSDQFIRNDIVDKVLLKDLPSLYGINDIQELNRLFSFLAYNAGNEASLEKISKESGISKPTIKKYIEYLESAFLIIKVQNVDDTCKTMKRERNFKIYLNNPSMRAALFAPVELDDNVSIGHLVESAIFSQWQHSPQARQLRYARWKNEGEVDIVFLSPLTERPVWVAEVKWSDRVKAAYGSQMGNISHFIRKNTEVDSGLLTTKTVSGRVKVDDVIVEIRPSALHCYVLGKNITSNMIKKLIQTPDNEEFIDNIVEDEDFGDDMDDFDHAVDDSQK
ncbi:ATP-binding protein [Xanthobacter autotrophicus]|uniref:ATP-binding protein n=1 Tax=Xanthobacter autotrophicus TaxID=280 RepID=UPI00372B1D88